MTSRLANRLAKNLTVVLASFTWIAARAQTKPPTTSVCEISKNPSQFDNKIVSLKATLAGNFEISAIRDPDHVDCGSLWFTYPGGGPEASVSINALVPTEPRPTVTLRRNSAFRHFQKMADAKMYAKSRSIGCADCNRYEVTATMTGLVEYAGPGHGFGHMNGFQVKFVLQSVQETVVKDISSRYKSADFSTKPVRFPTGFISGRVIGPDNKPIADGDLTIYSPTDPDAHIEDDTATTDERGRFKFAVPPGRYIIGFNTFYPPAPKFPFPPTYYPSAQERSNAQAVEVKDLEHRRNIVVRLTKTLTPRTIPILVLWPNGKPVDDANVWLSEKTDPTNVVGISVSHTSSDGKFDLMGFEGIDYILHADIYGGLAQVSCNKPTTIRASQAITSSITVPLVIKDFHICQSEEFEAPQGQ